LQREAERSQGSPKHVRDDAKPARRERKPQMAGARAQSRKRPQGDFITFQVSWGGEAGADTRKLLAMVCRRGDVSSELVGAIRVSPKSSTVDILASEAVRIMNENKITNLFIVEDGRPVGIIHVHDCLRAGIV